jgi:putative transposase
MRIVLSVAEFSSAAYYGARKAGEPKGKPGPRPTINDDEALKEIRAELKQAMFNGEGHMKIYKRLKKRNVVIGKNRTLEIMRKNNLLSPNRPKHNGSSRVHDGKIITEKPNQMWGTDGKRFFTEHEGWCWFFGVIDHCTDEILAHQVCKVGNRFRAIDALRLAVRKEFGDVAKGICKGELSIRCDHGSQFDSDDYQKELKFLDIKHSPAFVRSPECNGVIERFHRTLEEQVFSIYQFKTLEEASIKIEEFIKNFNDNWLIGRHGYCSPVEYKKKLIA